MDDEGILDISLSLNKSISIPEQLRTGQFRFIRLKKGGKEPIDRWKDENYTYGDPILSNWLGEGGNYGVICVAGDCCIVDGDNYTRLEQLGATDSFSDTFTVKTGSDDGYHYYIKCSGLKDKKIPFYDLVVGNEHLGEVYPAGSPAYCVGPGCLHPSGNRYQVVNDSPIKRVTIEELDTTFFSKVRSSRITAARIDQLMQKMPVSRGRKRKSNDLIDSLGLRIEDIGYPAGDVTKRGDEIQGSHPIHGSTTGQNYAINTKKGTWYCFRCQCGGDYFSFLAVKEGLIRCDDAGTGDISPSMFVELKEILRNKYGYKKQLDELDNNWRPDKSVRVVEDAGGDVDVCPIQLNQGYRYEPILPDNHFLTHYVDTIAEMTDSYQDYQYAAGIMLISLMMQRKAYINAMYGKIYPNIWSFLLGASSYSKKTTAIKFFRFFCNLISPNNALPNDMSPERFIQEVDEYPVAWQAIDEVSNLLNAMQNKSYMASYREMLCLLYDDTPYKMGRSKRTNKFKKKDDQNDWIIKDTYLNLFWATTPDAFGGSTEQIDMTSGLFYRFLFFYPHYDKEIMPTTMRTEQQEKALLGLKDRLSRMFQFFGSNPLAELEFMYSKEALQFLQAWELKHTKENHEQGNKIRESVFSRMSVSAQKLAEIFTAGLPEFYNWVFCKNFLMCEGEKYDISFDMLKEACRQVDVYFLPVFEEIVNRICS